jgi:hypothetical protein
MNHSVTNLVTMFKAYYSYFLLALIYCGILHEHLISIDLACCDAQIHTEF